MNQVKRKYGITYSENQKDLKEVRMSRRTFIIKVVLIPFVLFLTLSSKYNYSINGGERYIVKEVAFIPWGEADSLLGLISGAEINEEGETTWVEPGEAVSSYDIDLKGNIYVADVVKKRISVYDQNGHYLRSIGTLPLGTDKIMVRTTSGKEKVIYTYYQGKYDPLKNETIPYPYKTYFDSPVDIAVDGNGNVYVIPSLSAKYLMKFSPEGKLLEIIDQFGEYGPEDIRDTDILFSDAYGHVYIDFGIKPKGRLTAEFSKSGNLLMISKYGPRDEQGKRYYIKYYFYDQPIEKMSNSAIFVVAEYQGDKIAYDTTFTIYFNRPISQGVGFYGVDGDGNIYLDVGWALHKYDQKGNLLAIINPPRDTVRTFKHPMGGMGTVSKIMANGDIYYAYMSDQGFVVVKQELQPETKGQILKPAVKPEK